MIQSVHACHYILCIIWLNNVSDMSDGSKRENIAIWACKCLSAHLGPWGLSETKLAPKTSLIKSHSKHFLRSVLEPQQYSSCCHAHVLLGLSLLSLDNTDIGYGMPHAPIYCGISPWLHVDRVPQNRLSPSPMLSRNFQNFFQNKRRVISEFQPIRILHGRCEPCYVQRNITFRYIYIFLYIGGSKLLLSEGSIKQIVLIYCRVKQHLSRIISRIDLYFREL